MTQELYTLELAKLHESQGYYQDAYAMYLALERENSTGQIRAGINRMKLKLASEKPETGPEEKIAKSLEQWLNLIVLKHRLDRFKQIKSRLI